MWTVKPAGWHGSTQKYLETGLLGPFQGYTEKSEHGKKEHMLN